MIKQHRIIDVLKVINSRLQAMGITRQYWKWLFIVFLLSFLAAPILSSIWFLVSPTAQWLRHAEGETVCTDLVGDTEFVGVLKSVRWSFDNDTLSLGLRVYIERQPTPDEVDGNIPITTPHVGCAGLSTRVRAWELGHFWPMPKEEE